MSTILKALQRLEDEKVAEVERPLDERIVARRASPRPTLHLGLAIGIAAVSGVAVAVAAFLLWPGRDDSDARLAQQPPSATSPVAAAAPAPVVAAEQSQPELPRPAVPVVPEQAQPSQIQVEDRVEVVERLDALPVDSVESADLSEPAEPLVVTRPTTKRPAAQKAEMPVVRETKPEVARQAEPEVEPAPEIVTRAPKPRPAAAYVRSEQPPAVERPAPVAEPSAKNVARLPEPAPKTEPTPNTERAPKAEPAPTTEPAPLAIAAAAPKPEAIRPAEQKIIPRAKVPALTLERTIWHPDPSRRLAIVKLLDSEEPLQLKEGDAIGPLVVKSIKPSSVVFDHDGIQVTYTVGG